MRKNNLYFWEDFGHPCLKFPKEIDVALKQTRANWEVKKSPVLFINKEQKTLFKVKDKFVLYREDTNKFIDIIGSDRPILQNKDAFEILVPYLEENYIEGVYQIDNSVHMIVPLINYSLSNRITPILMATHGHHTGASLKLEVYLKDEVSKVLLLPFHTKGGNLTLIRETSRTYHADLQDISLKTSKYLDKFLALESKMYHYFSNLVIDENNFDAFLTDTMEVVTSGESTKDSIFAGVEEQWLYSETISEDLRETAIGLLLAIAEYHQHIRRFDQKKGRYKWNTRLDGAKHLRYAMKYLTEKLREKENENKTS